MSFTLDKSPAVYRKKPNRSIHATTTSRERRRRVSRTWSALPLTQAARIVLPDAGFEAQSRPGRVVRVPIVCALRGGRIPDRREIVQMAEECFEEVHAM